MVSTHNALLHVAGLAKQLTSKAHASATTTSDQDMIEELAWNLAKAIANLETAIQRERAARRKVKS